MNKRIIKAMQIGNKMITLFYPQRCPFCDGILEMGESGACTTCMSKLRVIREDFCMKCGKKLENAQQEYCEDCKTKKHLYKRGRIFLVNEEIVKKSVYRFKYAGRKAYAKTYVELMGECMNEFVLHANAQGIVPVPLHFLRFHKRGYNQAYLLAKEFGKKYGIKVYKNYVKRQINTSPQKFLDEAGRQNNLKKAFKINQNDVKLDTIILFDDIYTTGSTIDAVTDVLLKNGVRQVYFIALAGGR